MSLENTHYNAFISYRHTEPDMYVAKNLHKKLESFKLPGDLVKKYPGLPKKIERVFRDQEELPLSTNLADPITDALQNSDNLIVICTPRLSESRWCLKEIETFIAMHGREHVFAVLAEGEPDESFPKQLLVDDDGNPMEPLAADFRGNNNREINKKMKNEILRLIAPMFGLNFDDLRQRHKEQRQKRIMAIGSAILVVTLAFAAYCGITALKINSQAKEIQEQNNQILAQNEEITKQAELIEEQYRQAGLKYANSVANLAERMMGEGIADETVYALRSAMPDTKEGIGKPYSEEAQSALTKALGVYNSGRFIPTDIFDAESRITGLWMSPSGTKIAALNASNNMYVWDVETKKCIREYYVGKAGYSNQYVNFASDNVLVAYDSDGEFILNLESGKKTYLTQYTVDVYQNKSQDKAVVYNDGIITIIDGATGEISDTIEVCEEAFTSVVSKMCLSEDGIVAMVYYDLRSQDVHSIRCYDIKTKELLMDMKIPTEDTVTEILVDDGNVYYSGAHSTGETILSYKGFLKKIDISSRKEIWETQLDSSVINLIMCEDNTGKYLCCSRYMNIYSIDTDTGKKLNTENTIDDMVGVWQLKDKSAVLAIDESGELYSYLPSKGLLGNVSSYTYNINGSVDRACFVQGNLFFHMDDNSFVTWYTSMPIEEMARVGEVEEISKVSPNGKFAVTVRYDDEGKVYDYEVYDILTRDMIYAFKDPTGIMFFAEDGNRLITCSSSVRIYDLNTCGLVKEFDIPKDYGIFEHSDKNSKFVYYMESVDEHKSIFSYSLQNGTATGMMIENIPDSNYDILVSFAPDESGCVFVDSVNSILYIYENGKGEPKYSVDVEDGANSVMYSSDGKYICIGYNNKTIRFFDKCTGELVKTIYNSVDGLVEVVSILYEDGYLVQGNTGVILNSNLDILAQLQDCVGYCSDNDSLIFKRGGRVYSSQLLTYEEIISLTDERLEGFEPSEGILEMYGIGG